MKRPKTQMPKRPRMAGSAVARTPKDAAIKLVRLEFDAARLQMGIDQAEGRADCYRAELDHNQKQRKTVMDILNG
ncbi:hypothetical protein BC777_0266 [Yoonia maricola]|uniref:Uncharacterized protein n=1 Tax=Yoonia maricola TaxID=420999 RepID=A0A2M8WKK3_9RHOB|nr:hypothetical protein [Yoonia maricola]PJI91438.1 hypothetical protein BC777_0266 [Yoonia maricola]